MNPLAILFALSLPALAQLPPAALTKREQPLAPPRASVSNGGAAVALAPEAPATQPTEARHFRLTITESSAQGALAGGGFYDLAPGATLPAAKFRTALDKAPDGPEASPLNKTWRSAGTVWVRGLSDVADGKSWKGMLEPDGVYRYSTVFGPKTVPAYKLSAAADPVVAYNAGKKRTNAPTALDQRPDSYSGGRR